MGIRTGAPLIVYDTLFDRARPVRFRVFASRIRPVPAKAAKISRRRKPSKWPGK